ncbi:MAG: serine/threonine-protein kinase [Thermoanaerobaculia bacterium]
MSITPRQIGPYVPLRKLGQGGMGVVYCALDSRDTSHLVALKVISQAAAGKRADAARRFLREARILEELRHPNIVSFYEIGEHEGQSYFAMELLTGGTLSGFCGRPFGEVVPLLIQICEGMEYLSSRSIVHRDLSPDNIFVIRDENRLLCKILDFGIAKNLAAEETLHDFTKTGMLMGKPQYWSPEQIGSLKPGEQIDWRSDVYALGVIFHRVLSGNLPFTAETPVAFMSAHIMEAPAELVAPDDCPAIPAEITSILAQMLAKDRTARPQSYREIADALRAGLAGVATDAEAETITKKWVQMHGDQDSQIRSEIASLSGTGSGSFTGEVTAPTGSTDEEEGTLVTPTLRTAPMRMPGTASTRPLPGTASTRPVPVTTIDGAPGSSRRALTLGIALAAVVVFGIGGFVLWNKMRHEAKLTVPGETLPSATPVTKLTDGTLLLDSVPWAKIVSVVDESTGKSLSVAADTTPATMKLPAARYAIQLVSGTGAETRTLHVIVPPGRSISESVALGTAESVVSLLDEASVNTR